MVTARNQRPRTTDLDQDSTENHWGSCTLYNAHFEPLGILYLLCTRDNEYGIWVGGTGHTNSKCIFQIL